jgi:surface carbohydrate biosynthesis protein (TIGR04326 family)
LLAEAFRWDVAKGGYFYNLLVYKAMRRFAQQQAPKRLLYPFENKAIEKLLLFGVREACPTCRTIGYQHTSITPRHTTFQFAPNEAQATPLPDLVVTAGDVTRRHLEKTGNFPRDMIATGCALRQRYSQSIITHDTADAEPIRILLALSSSKFELVKAIEFMRSVKSLSAQLEIGVRPHPEFPMSLLPEHLRTWVSAQAMDFSSSSLASNIEWCTAAAYVSSTVALEALMQGKPVINLDLGEIVAPDPALDPPPLWRRVSTPQGFLTALDSLRTASPQEKLSDRNVTTRYVQSYFRPPTADAIRVFLS